MSDQNYSFIVVKYDKPETAELALAAVVGLSKDKIIKLRDAVAVTKTTDGKIKLHQTKDDSAGKGLLKGGLIGVLFAVLFGPAGWVVAGAALGTAFGLFDRGVKNKLMKELGQDMTSSQSALVLLVEEADWQQVIARMEPYNFNGTTIIKELVTKDAEALEKLVDAPPADAGAVPAEVEIPAAAEGENTPQA